MPQGQPGHLSRARTKEQASKVLKAASGQPTGYVKVVKVSQTRYSFPSFPLPWPLPS